MTRSMLLLGISALTYASAASAQQTPAPDATAQPAPADPGVAQDIVVTGIRESLERPAEIKQDAPQVVDSIVSQDIGKFPDPTTAAALQRVPGVQVSVSQSNEIGNVKVRGLGDILTTLGGIDDRVDGLNAGGDDYLVKPFAFSELAARVAALGRRPRRTAVGIVLRVADLEVDLLARSVRRAGRSIDLQPREFRLLEFLMRHSGQVVTRTMLLERVWNLHFDPRTNVVESHVSRLRAKIDKGHPVALIQTLRGAGYCLREAP